MLRRVVRWTGLALVVLLPLIVFGVVPYWMAGLATTRRFQVPDKENAGLTPARLGLAAQEVEFQAPDGVRLAGWWLPAPEARGSVVLLHGLNRSRLEMLRKVVFLREQGWSALLFDQRRHGGSGGDATTFGARERYDAAAAVALARSRQPGPVVLWGVSLGAASATLAAADDASIAGLVCDSSFLSLRDTVAHHVRLFRGFRWWLRLVPPWPLAPSVVYWMGRRGRFDPDSVDIRTAAARLGSRPSLFVCNSGDRRMPPAIAAELCRAAGPQARLLQVQGNSHGGAWRDGTAEYSKAVAALLASSAGPPAGAGSAGSWTEGSR